jgi:hypothetical protein
MLRHATSCQSQFTLYSTQSFTPTPSPSTPPPPSPFLGKFCISAYSDGGLFRIARQFNLRPQCCTLCELHRRNRQLLLALRKIYFSDSDYIYFSAKACGLALEVGLFNDSLCMMSASYSHLSVDRMPSMLPLSTPAKPFIPQFSGIYSSNCLSLMILRTRAV